MASNFLEPNDESLKVRKSTEAPRRSSARGNALTDINNIAGATILKIPLADEPEYVEKYFYRESLHIGYQCVDFCLDRLHVSLVRTIFQRFVEI